MQRKLRCAGALYAKYKTETGNLKSSKAKPVLPSRNTLGVCVAPRKIRAAVSPQRLLGEESILRVPEPNH